MHCLQHNKSGGNEGPVLSEMSLQHPVRYALGVPLFALLAWGGMVFAAETETPAKPEWNAENILGSKHDLTHLNQRAGADAMQGVAYSNYGDACVYCHIPPDADTADDRPGQLEGWNRIRPMTDQYQLFTSQSATIEAGEPNDISLLCLSCHDGTLAVDRVAHKPRTWDSSADFSLHMKMKSDDDLTSCGKCHDGSVAHSIASKSLGTDLRDDHPISIRYAGLDSENRFFKTAESPAGFANGIRLLQGIAFSFVM